MATAPTRTPTVFTLADVQVGAVDRLGYTIESLYAVSADYAVYRSNKRVSVQYSDVPATALAQQTQLGALNMLRGQISSLIDGWREGADAEAQVKLDATWFGGVSTAGLNRKRAERYDRQVADALLSALQGQLDTAKTQLGEIKNDIVSERQSIARIDYLIVALAMTGVLILATWILSTSFFSGLFGRFGVSLLPIWTAAAGGTLGAFFSIATGIKGRTVLMDLQNRDNRADAILRMLIGTISGAILLVMLSSDLVTNALVQTADLKYTGPDDLTYSVQLVYILGFIAGFAERLVPDQLEKARLALEDKAPTPPPPPPPAAPPAPPLDPIARAEGDELESSGTGDGTPAPVSGTSSAN